MLSAVLAWWVLQLRGLVPGWLWRSEQDRVRRQALVLDVMGWSPCAVEVAVRRGGREGALGRFTLDPAGIAALRAAAARHLGRVAVLRLPAGVLLEKRASFPLIAERHLASVLAYEMDGITPFSANELFWSWRVARRDGMRVHALLSLVPRAPLMPVLDALRQAGIRPALLQSPDATGGVSQVPLELARGMSWRQRARAGLMGVCMVLAAGAVVTPSVLQAVELGRVEERIAALQPQVERVETLRRANARNAARTDVVMGERAAVGEALRMVAVLSDALPDDTYLTDLTIQARRVTLRGRSAVAARLIATLAADGRVRNPAFASAMTRIEAGGGEGFSIHAEMAQ